MTTTTPLTFGPADLAALQTAHPEVRVIDVRTPAEYAAAHVPGSVNVPLPDLDEHRAELTAPGAGPTVLVCRSGRRAAAAEAQTRVLSIDNKLAALKDYTSNMGETLPDVQALFTDGLMLESISYDGTVGQYDVQFKTKDIQLFLQLKEKIYQNKGYYLNLTLSSDLDETGLYNCRLSFTPSSYIALPAPTPAPEQTPVETTPEDLLQDIGGNN